MLSICIFSRPSYSLTMILHFPGVNVEPVTIAPPRSDGTPGFDNFGFFIASFLAPDFSQFYILPSSPSALAVDLHRAIGPVIGQAHDDVDQ